MESRRRGTGLLGDLVCALLSPWEEADRVWDECSDEEPEENLED